MLTTSEAVQCGLLLDELLTDADCDGVLFKPGNGASIIVKVSAYWTDWEDHSYEGGSLLLALNAAVAEKRLNR